MFASIPYFRMCSILPEPEGGWLHREAGQLGLTRHSIYLTHHLDYEYGYLSAKRVFFYLYSLVRLKDMMSPFIS
jgi:hypothetical protein